MTRASEAAAPPAGEDGAAAVGTPAPAAGSDDWRLHDEREFLRTSLADAASEHEAGDLSDADYALLRRRDERQLADVEAAIAARQLPPSAAGVRVPATSDLAPRPAGPVEAEAEGAAIAPANAPPARRRRRWLAAGGVAAIAAATILLVVELTTPRLPGETATGSVTLNAAQQVERELAQAQALVSAHQPTRALELYGQVLTQDPRDPVALAEWGWLDWQAASRAKEATVAAEGASAIEEAVRLDPSLYAAQYYLGTILLREGASAKAVAHYARFLADHPPRGWIANAAAGIRTAYGAVHRAVPAGLPAVAGG